MTFKMLQIVERIKRVTPGEKGETNRRILE